jgi:hypothetical protein
LSFPFIWNDSLAIYRVFRKSPAPLTSMRWISHRDPDLGEHKAELGKVNSDNRFPRRKSGSEAGFDQFG